MAFPSVLSVTQTGITSNVSSHPIDMPATVNAGDLLLVTGTLDGGPTISNLNGFTQIAYDTGVTTVRIFCLARKATGSEGGTSITITSSATEQSAFHVFRIPTGDWYDSGDLTEALAVSAFENGLAAAPSLTVPWSSDDYLWIAFQGNSHSGSLTGAPTNYGNFIATLGTKSTQGADAYSARRERAASSESYDLTGMWASGSFAVRSALLAVRPGGVVGGPAMPIFANYYRMMRSR